MDSTTFKSVLKLKFMDVWRHMSKGNCVSLCTHSKSRYVGYMYFWTVCMQMHSCLLNEKKRKKNKPNHTSTEIQLCLREVFCCSWGLRIFLRNKKKPCKACFCFWNRQHRPITERFVLARVSTKPFYSFIYRQGLLVEGAKKAFMALLFEKQLFYTWKLPQRGVLLNHFWTLACENVSGQRVWVSTSRSR